MGTLTTNLDLYKPDQGETGWSAEVNANFDTLDTRLHKPLGVQYVDMRGDNDNDGLTPGTAKKDVVSAFDALDANGGGRIRVISSVTGGDIPFWDYENLDQGLWVVGPNDPRWASVPTNGPDAEGFRRARGQLYIEGWGSREWYNDAVGQAASMAYIAKDPNTDPMKPDLWLSGAGGMFRNIRCVGRTSAMKIGLDTTDGTTNVNTAAIDFRDCMFSSLNHASYAAVTEPTIRTGYVFWLRFRNCTLGHSPTVLTTSSIALDAGTTYLFTTATDHGFVVGDIVDALGHTPSGYNGDWVVTAVPSASTFKADIGTNPAALSVAGTIRAIMSDRQSVLLMEADGAESNPGLTLFEDCTFASGGVRYRPNGNSSYGTIVMQDTLMEGDFVNDCPPIFCMPPPSASVPFHPISAGSGFMYFRNLSIADGGAPYGTLNFEGLPDPAYAVAVNCGEIIGHVTSAGGNQYASLLDGDKVGMFQSESRRFFGEHDGHRRAFHPTVARYANLAPYDETTWEAGSGTATVTTGQAGPDGSTRAGLLTAVAANDGTMIYSAARTVNVGDFFIVGGWCKSGANGWTTQSDYRPLLCSIVGDLKFDTVQVPSTSLQAGAQLNQGRTGDGDWQFAAEAGQIVEGTPGSVEVRCTLLVRNGWPIYFYAPVLIHIPVADGLTYAEAREIRDALCAYSNELSVGEVGTLRGQTFNAVGGAKIGDGGKVSKVLTASTTYDPANMATDASSTGTTLTVTGAAVGDPAFAGLTTLTTQAVLITAHVTATNTVRVDLLNKSGGALDLGSGTLKVTVFQNA